MKQIFTENLVKGNRVRYAYPEGLKILRKVIEYSIVVIIAWLMYDSIFQTPLQSTEWGFQNWKLINTMILSTGALAIMTWLDVRDIKKEMKQ